MIWDLKADFLEVLDLLKDVFIGNSYPQYLVTKTLNESWPRKTLKAVLKGVQLDVEVENDKDFFEVLHAPYEPHGGTPGTRKFSQGFDHELIIFLGKWNEPVFHAETLEITDFFLLTYTKILPKNGRNNMLEQAIHKRFAIRRIFQFPHQLDFRNYGTLGIVNL